MAEPQSAHVRIEGCEKHIRTYLGGELVCDTTAALYVWNLPQRLAYFLPRKDVRAELLVPSERHEELEGHGLVEYFDIVAKHKTAKDAARRFPAAPQEMLQDYLRLDWQAMDAWFEEDEQVYVHPRDPYHRVDICASSRHIEVQLNGTVIADSNHARLLFETNCPTRYYLPLVDVRLELLQESKTVTRCPYKGSASYWSIDLDGTVYEDYVWGYRSPLPESAAIAGYAAFYNEKMDIYVDGVLDARSAARARR